MGRQYGRLSQILAGIISTGLCIGLAALMAKAGGEVLRDVFGLAPWPAVIVVAGITTLYTTVGGLRGSVVTDAFQFMVFAVILPLVLIWLVTMKLPGGWQSFVVEARTATQLGWQGLSGMEVLGLVTAFLLGETLIPPYVNRALAARSTEVSRRGFILAGGFSIVWFVVMCALGICARGFIGQGIEDDAVLLNLVRLAMPGAWYSLLMLVLISVIMSSFDSLLNAGAVAFVEDVLRPLTRFGDPATLYASRISTFLLGITAAFLAVEVPTIIGGLLVCYSIWAPAILPALLLGLWISRPCPFAGFLSMIVGSVVALLYQFVLPDFYPQCTQLPGILPSLVVALTAYGVGHALGRWSGQRKESA